MVVKRSPLLFSGNMPADIQISQLSKPYPTNTNAVKPKSMSTKMVHKVIPDGSSVHMKNYYYSENVSFFVARRRYSRAK